MAGHVHGATQGTKLFLSLGMTTAFVGIEAFYGYRAHSLALLSDAGHNLSDALALALAAYAVWVAKRPATPRKTFGYHRVAILTALANAAALLVIAGVILWEAAQGFVRPPPAQGLTMAAVAAVALLMNTVIASWLKGDAAHSLNSRAAYVHMLGDALSSAGVLAAGLLVHFTGWRYADPLVSALIAAFIVYSSWGILTEATNVLLEGTPDNVDVDALVRALKATPPVTDVHDLHLWTVGDGLHFLSCHVVLPPDTTMDEASCAVSLLNTRLHDDFGIAHATIQTETHEGALCRDDVRDLLCGLERTAHSPGCTHAH